MTVFVDNITKIYSNKTVVDDLSFSMKKGEVVGFLGPNGAGKTTTMKCIVGYIEPSNGSVYIQDQLVARNTKEIQQYIGYLPEHNPLYLDMYVQEYLAFIASLYHIKNKNQRIQDVIDLVGLQPEKSKKIQTLSKGYRQRVGLAQALINDPEVLILDEPTTGLDPNQIVEIRALIKELGKDKTILLSTHIMQEVQAICDRVLILNNGALKADESVDNLQSLTSSTAQTLVEFKETVDWNIFQAAFQNSALEIINNHSATISNPMDQDIREEIFKFAITKNLTLKTLYRKEESLEHIFHDITQEE